MSLKEGKQKILVIVGPTASGKTSLSIELAKQFNGEIISADSRQVYRKLDIGTEKVTEEEMGGVPHHLIDIRDPEETYTAHDFVTDARTCIEEIAKRGKLPIIVGGTFFYVEALLGRKQTAPVPENPELRKNLERKTVTELFEMLTEKDPARAETIDQKNKRRLIRALEIVDALGVVPKTPPQDSPYDALIIGIDVPREELRESINRRLEETLEKGLIDETKSVLEGEVSEERLNELGLEYRIILRYLKGELEEDEIQTELHNKLWQYAKRQYTWLKKMENIRWFKREEKAKIIKKVEDFLCGR